jgi:selenide,water dikinase
LGVTQLAQVLSQLPKQDDKNLIVNLSTNEDAGVYKISDDKALVQTLDFFTPVVNSPYKYGAISAANSLSDVYAMGGTPLTAMNIVCFPPDLPLEILGEILKGGADKVKEKEPKFGLSVTGIVHPDKVLINCNLKSEDVLILTKPLGTGILTTALKRKLVNEDEINDCIEGMMTLNKKACEIMIKYNVNSCTDITGFGFLGHLKEMCIGSNKGVDVFIENFKYYKNAYNFTKKGSVPKGCKDNLESVKDIVEFSNNIDLEQKYLLSDPQTSGGLLISINYQESEKLLNELKNNNVEAFIVGKVNSNKNIFVI